MSEKPDERTLSYEHLKQMVTLQKKVRNCEVEGMVWDIEAHLKVLDIWDLISFSEYEELVAILEG